MRAEVAGRCTREPKQSAQKVNRGNTGDSGGERADAYPCCASSVGAQHEVRKVGLLVTSTHLSIATVIALHLLVVSRGVESSNRGDRRRSGQFATMPPKGAAKRKAAAVYMPVLYRPLVGVSLGKPCCSREEGRPPKSAYRNLQPGGGAGGWGPQRACQMEAWTSIPEPAAPLPWLAWPRVLPRLALSGA